MFRWKKPHPILDQVFQLDLRSLALFRVGLGLMLIVDILNRFPNLTAHYTDFGALPRTAILEHGSYPHYLSLHMLSGHVSIMGILFGISIIVSTLLVFGYRTRLMTFIAWFLLISLHARSPIILQAGDVLLRLLVFWAFFLPLGARFSIDSAMSESKDHYKLKAINGAACGAYMLQVAFIYWFGVFLKSGDEWWPDLTAVYFALHLDQFATHLGIWIRQFPTLLKFFTAKTLVVETIVPLMFFIPWKSSWFRGFAIIVLAGMHMGFIATMKIGQFPFIDCVSFLPLIPSAFWDWLGSKLKTARRTGLQIFYDGPCGFCRKSVLIIRECFLLRSTPINPASGEIAELIASQHSWVVVDHEGNKHTKSAAMAEVWACSPILGPFAWILRLAPVRKVADFVYDKIAANRMRIGPAFAQFMPSPAKIRCQPTLFNEILVLLFFVYVVWWNVATTKMFPEVRIHSQWSWVGQLFRIDQRWGMFAPYPKKDTGWFVITGELINGKKVDVFNAKLGEPSFDKPEYVSSTFISQRWRKYLLNISNSKNNDYLLYYGKYICRSWNRINSGGLRIKNFQIYYVRQIIKLDYKYSDVQRILRWKHYCFKKPS